MSVQETTYILTTDTHEQTRKKVRSLLRQKGLRIFLWVSGRDDGLAISYPASQAIENLDRFCIAGMRIRFEGTNVLIDMAYSWD